MCVVTDAIKSSLPLRSSHLWTTKRSHEDLVAAYIDLCGGTPLDVNFNSESDKNTLFLEKVIFYSSHP